MPAPVETQLDYTHADFAIGQGSQKVGNGKDLVEKYPTALEVWNRADALLLPSLGLSLKGLALEGKQGDTTLDSKEAEELLTKTEHAQPAVIIDALVRVAALREANLLALPGQGEPGYHAYNSVGIIAAAVNAGALTEEGGARLGEGRGRAFEYAVSHSPKTTMFALSGVDENRIEELQKQFGLEVCLRNSDTQVVLGGEVTNKTGHDVTHALAFIVEQDDLKERVAPLKVDAAFHSKWMEPAVPRYGKTVSEVDIVTPTRGKLVGGTTVAVLETVAAIKNELVLQLTKMENTAGVWHLLRKLGVSTVTELSGEARFMRTLQRQFEGKFTRVIAEKDGPTFAFRWNGSAVETVEQPAAPVAEVATEKYSKDQVADWMKAWWTDRSGMEPEEVTEATMFADMGDSEDVLAARAAGKAQFGKNLPDDESKKMTTLGQAIDAYHRMLNS